MSNITENFVENFITEKYGSLVNIFKDSCNTIGDKLLQNTNNTCEIRAFSNQYIIYLKNPNPYQDAYYNNGVPHIPFDFGIKYSGDVNDIKTIRHLNDDNEDFGDGHIFIFETTRYFIGKLTADPEKNGMYLFKHAVARPDYLDDEKIKNIKSFSTDKNLNITFNF